MHFTWKANFSMQKRSPPIQYSIIIIILCFSKRDHAKRRPVKTRHDINYYVTNNVFLSISRVAFDCIIEIINLVHAKKGSRYILITYESCNLEARGVKQRFFTYLWDTNPHFNPISRAFLPNSNWFLIKHSSKQSW